MADRLGIDIKVNFPEANKLKQDFDKKWKAMADGYKAEVKVKADDSSMRKMRSQINKFFSTEKIEVKLKLNTTEAMADLKAFQSKFHSLKSEMEKGVALKVNAASGDSKNLFSNIAKNGDQVNTVVRKTNDGITRMASGLQTVNSTFDKVARSTTISNNGMVKNQSAINKTISSFQKETATYVNGQVKSLKSTYDRTSALKEIGGVMKEINSLGVQAISSDKKSSDLIKARISQQKSYLSTLKSNFKDVFGNNAADDFMIKNIRNIGEYNIKMKQVAVEKNKQKEADKETASVVKRLISLENERFNLLKRSDSAGKEEAAVLRKQAEVLEDKGVELREQTGIISKLTVGQAQSLNLMIKENDAARDLSNSLAKAKSVDAARVASQKATYSNLKGELKEIYSLQDRIVALTARQNAGVMSGKEEAELQALRGQLRIKEQLHNATKSQAASQDALTSSQRESLAATRKEYTERNKVAQAVEKSNANVKKSVALYDEVKSSIKSVASLNEKLASAGKREASTIRSVIAAEEAKQANIMDSIKAQGLMNASIDKELSKRRHANAEITQQNALLARSRRQDTTLNSAAFGMAFNPRTVMANARQAFQVVYDSVAKIDEQMINIGKVADVPQEVMESFGENLYGYASEVGRSADAYAESVGRWVTTGKTLSESIELANASVMGSFVGNIEEDAMVKYMAVPLNAYKDDMLEAGDIINSMNEVSNNNAVEMNDLGAAYERAAATASNAGTSFSQLTGMITGAQEATRAGGEKIGTAMKAIDVNFGKISSKLTKGDNGKFEWFQNIGVDIQDANGELKSSFDILSQLQTKWSGLSKNDRATAAFYAAGKQHASVFTGMLENWATVTKATGEANQQIALFDKESGSAYVEFGKQQDSVQFKAANLSNTWAEFLNVISGGKDGVMNILAGLSDMISKMTEIAKNPAIRQLGIFALKATAFLTFATGLKMFYGFISTSAIGAVKALGGVLPLLTKTGRTAARAARVDALAGTTRGIGTAIKGFGRFIPVIGGVITVMSLLDMAGVPVWETIGKGIKAVTDSTSEATKELSKYKKEQEKTTENLGKNKILNGEIEQINKTIESYQELKKTKEKTFEQTGDESDKSYSVEEFETIKKSFNQQAEALGLDIRITMNNYDEIEKKYKKLIEYKKAVTAEEAGKLTKDLDDKSKYSDNSKLQKLQKDKAGIHNLAQWGQQDIYDNPSKYSDFAEEGNASWKAIQEEAKKTMAILGEWDEFGGDFFNSKEMKAANKEALERIEETKAIRKSLVGAAQAGTLQEGFGEFEEKKQKQTIAFLSSELPLIKKKTDMTKDLTKSVQEGIELTPQQQSQLIKLNKDFANYGEFSSKWTDEQKESVLSFLAETTAASESSQQDLENSLYQLGAIANMNEEEIKGMIEASRNGGQAFVDLMSTMGEQGATVLGVTESMMIQYKDKWPEAVKNLQSQLEKLPAEKQTKYKLVGENGVANFDKIDDVLALPDIITKQFKIQDADGNINLENTVGLLDHLNGLDDTIKKELNLKTDKDGIVDIASFAAEWEKLDGEKEQREFIAKFAGDNTDLKQKLTEALTGVSEVDNAEGTAKAKGDNSDAVNKADEAAKKTEDLNNKSGTTQMKGDKTDFDNKKNEVDADTKKERTLSVKIKGVADTIVDWWKNLTNGSSKSVSVGISGHKKEGKSSVAIANPDMGRSFSRSVGDQLDSGVKSKSVRGGNPRYSDEAKNNERVDEDIWRYWAKELFQGLPLEKSMENLNQSITKAKDNQDKLISLYRQQIAQIDKQIAYQNEMKGAKQSELNSVMAELRKNGFTTSGNQVTNLGISKNFKGEKANEMGTLLNQYKELYSAIDGLNGTISTLQMDKLGAQDSMAEAVIAKELKVIENHIKKSEALLRAVSNNTSLMSTKESMVSDQDVELKLSISEEGLNSSARNVSMLTDEFNRLSTINVDNAENAKNMQSALENLKTEILSNADAVLTYKQALNDIRIDRLISDFSKFNEVITSNVDKLSNNIENLKTGLVDGSDFGDLISSSFNDINFDRKSKLEKEQEERLKLEAELNEALENYANKNVDRTSKVANAILSVEKSKYQGLLQMAADFTNGKVADVKVTNPNIAIGLTGSQPSKDKTEYNAWLENLKKVNAAYGRAMAEMRDKYDAAMDSAKTKVEKEALTNKLIIDQLRLQEKIYRDIVLVNKDAVKNAKKELENTSLTTEQRDKLLDAIKEYEQASSDAQNSIKETISSRYEFEFELMDKATAKAEKYSESLNKLLSIANFVNSSSSSKQGIVESIYDAKVNQYSKAREQLAKLTDEQNKFAEGSYEWNLLAEKIEAVKDGFNDLTLEILEANKNVLGNTLDGLKEDSEKGLLGGKTLEEWKDQRDKWFTGIEKEIELEKLRKRMIELESNVNKEKLEILDRQDKVSKKDIEYLDKQTKVLELQEKLNNISKERKVQTLAKNDDGTWGWEYVADQTEYDKTKEELQTAEKDLEEYKQTQRENYATDLGGVIDKAKDGKYENSEELMEALNNLKAVYGTILGDIPEITSTDTDDIVKAYQEYLEKNKDIISNITDGKDNPQFQGALDTTAKQFEASFKNVSSELGKIIGEEIRAALNLAETTPLANGRHYTIEHQTLEFPNVNDASGLEEVFKSLPQVVDQVTLSK